METHLTRVFFIWAFVLPGLLYGLSEQPSTRPAPGGIAPATQQDRPSGLKNTIFTPVLGHPIGAEVIGLVPVEPEG